MSEAAGAGSLTGVYDRFRAAAAIERLRCGRSTVLRGTGRADLTLPMQ